jgi:hypothetical protein
MPQGEKILRFVCIVRWLKRQNDTVGIVISEPSRVHKFDGPRHVECVQSDEQPSQGSLLRRQKPAVPSPVRDDGQQTHGLRTQSSRQNELSQGKRLKEIKCYIWLAVEDVVLCLLIPSRGSQSVVKTRRQFFCELLTWKVHSPPPPLFSKSKFLWGGLLASYQTHNLGTRDYTSSGRYPLSCLTWVA